MTKTLKTRTGLSADPIIVILIVVMVAIECVLQLAETGLIGPENLRALVYQRGGFWPGRLGDWNPDYAGLTLVMFATYAFLHGGVLHLAVNMVTLWSLGGAVIERAGRRSFALIYSASIIGGALGYALLSTSSRPMVGASGALFGLAGAWLAWESNSRIAARSSLWPIVRIVLILIALNVVLYYAVAGQLAWQAHAGGLVAGWLVATLTDRVRRGREG